MKGNLSFQMNFNNVLEHQSVIPLRKLIALNLTFLKPTKRMTKSTPITINMGNNNGFEELVDICLGVMTNGNEY